MTYLAGGAEPQKATEFAQKGLAIAQETKTKFLEANNLGTLAGAYLSLGDTQKTLEFAQASLAIAREIKNRILETGALSLLGSTYLVLGQVQKAFELSQQSLARAREIKSPLLEGLSLASLSSIYNRLGEPQKAVELAQQALVIAQERKYRQIEMIATATLSDIYSQNPYSLGEPQKAIELSERALTLTRETKDRFYESLVLSGMSSIYARVNRDYQKALKYAQASLAIARENKIPHAELMALLNLLYVHFCLGDYQKALEFNEQSLKIARQSIKLRYIEANLLGTKSVIYSAQGNSQKALKLAQSNLKSAQEFDDRQGERLALSILRSAYVSLENYDKAIQIDEQELASARKRKDLDKQKVLLGSLGNLYHKVGRTKEAIASYQEALTIFTKTKIPSDNSEYQANLARIYRDLNQPVTAIAYYKEASNGIEQVRRINRGLSSSLQESFLQDFIDDVNKVKRVDIYRELADLLLQQGQISAAQQVLELLKVQELKDFTRNTNETAGRTPKTILTPTEEQIIKENGTLIAFGQRLVDCQQINCPQLSHLRDQRDALSEQFNQKIQTIEKQVRARLAQDRAALDTQDVSRIADKIVSAQPGTVLIYPLVLKDKIWLLWASRGSIVKSVEVPIGQRQLGETVFKFRQLLQQPSSDMTEVQATGKQLYDWLIKPLEPELKANKIQNLVFALDRAARYIPMSALFDGNKYLVENYALSTVLSADLTDMSARLPTGAERTSVLGLGVSDAVGGFNSLPNVPAELNAIIRTDPSDTQGIYPGQELLNRAFDFRALRDRLPGHQVLHVATHGEFKPGLAYESYLLLGNGEKLPIPKIEILPDLGNVQLVVLSACETALGGPAEDGTEIAGISYYFLNGGAKAVMASLWQVSDTSTSLLMQQFYNNLAKSTAQSHLTKSSALRQAQLNLIHGNQTTAANSNSRGGIDVQPLHGNRNASAAKGFSHPYYWAPFILIGNGL